MTEHPGVMMDRLLQEKHNLILENEKLFMAIRWALGEAPDSEGKWFSEDRSDRAPGQGRRYWWRSHLRKLANLEK